MSETDLVWVWALYHGEISYQDAYLRGFLAKVEELGLFEDTMIVITNDHGEELEDNGGLGHGWRLYEDPLMVYYPPLFPAGKRVDTIVEDVDRVEGQLAAHHGGVGIARHDIDRRRVHKAAAGASNQTVRFSEQ